MLYDYHDSDNESRLSDRLKAYFLKRCDISEKQLADLLLMAKELPSDLLENRLTVMADYFFRLKNESKNGKIHNEFAYAKKIILSDSFFENQRIDSSIPTVQETQQYLEAKKKERRLHPGVDKVTFHQKVAQINDLYLSSRKIGQMADIQHKDRKKAQEKMANVLKKLEDEETIKEMEIDILKTYKGLHFCELDYRLFKIVLVNMYLYHSQEAYQMFLSLIQKRNHLSIADLSKIRDCVITSRTEEQTNEY